MTTGHIIADALGPTFRSVEGCFATNAVIIADKFTNMPF